MSTPESEHVPNPTVDDGSTAASVTPRSLRPIEGPGIADTDPAEARARAGDVGKENFAAAADPENNRS